MAFAVAVGFEGWQAGFAAHMVAADDRIITGEAVCHESVRRVTFELYAQAAIFRRMPWSGRQHLAIADVAAKRLR